MVDPEYQGSRKIVEAESEQFIELLRTIGANVGLVVAFDMDRMRFSCIVSRTDELEALEPDKRRALLALMGEFENLARGVVEFLLVHRIVVQTEGGDPPQGGWEQSEHRINKRRDEPGSAGSN